VARALSFAWLQESSFLSSSSTHFHPVIARQSFDGAETGSLQLSWQIVNKQIRSGWTVRCGRLIYAWPPFVGQWLTAVNIVAGPLPLSVILGGMYYYKLYLQLTASILS
jgi:hypothetical protein